MSDDAKKADGPSSESVYDYCTMLREQDSKMQDSYDKLVIALSGGGFGLTLVFLKDVVGSGPIVAGCALILGWLAWIASLFAALAAYYCSHRGLQKLHDDLSANPCSKFSNAWLDFTRKLNVFAGASCIIGILMIAAFVFFNLGG